MKAKQATKRARKIQPRWEEIFAALGDGLVVLDGEKCLIGINPAGESISGFFAESVLGRFLEDAFEENRKVLGMLAPSFEEGTALTLRDVPWRRKGGGRSTIDLSSTPLFDEEGELAGWILVFRDLTPVKSLEEEVRKSDRLAMMGTIAAGLAHEIKNPLGGIKGAAQLLLRERLSSEAADCLRIIVKESDRVDRLIGQLLALAKPRTLDLEPVNINELLDSLLLLEGGPMKPRKIRAIREFDPSLPPVLGNPDELRQAFLNFIKNAMEAVSEGGKIVVRSRLVTDFKIKGKTGKRPIRFVQVTVHDNGSGISPENLDKIFTPFFSTKSAGSGLGLAIAQRIVTEHGGILKVSSEPGQGTMVQVLLRSGV